MPIFEVVSITIDVTWTKNGRSAMPVVQVRSTVFYTLTLTKLQSAKAQVGKFKSGQAYFVTKDLSFFEVHFKQLDPGSMAIRNIIKSVAQVKYF